MCLYVCSGHCWNCSDCYVCAPFLHRVPFSSAASAKTASPAHPANVAENSLFYCGAQAAEFLIYLRSRQNPSRGTRTKSICLLDSRVAIFHLSLLFFTKKMKNRERNIFSEKCSTQVMTNAENELF